MTAEEISIPLQPNFRADSTSCFEFIPAPHKGMIFVLENVVRSLINERLKDKYGANWFDVKATVPMK